MADLRATLVIGLKCRLSVVDTAGNERRIPGFAFSQEKGRTDMAKITRAGRRELDRIDAAWSKERNFARKKKERSRRDAQMMAAIRGGSLPYPPNVMSWLSRKLEKRSTRITQADVKSLLS